MVSCDYHINRGEMDRPDGCVSQRRHYAECCFVLCAASCRGLIELHVEYVLERTWPVLRPLPDAIELIILRAMRRLYRRIDRNYGNTGSADLFHGEIHRFENQLLSETYLRTGGNSIVHSALGEAQRERFENNAKIKMIFIGL